jgi:alpha-tubulin suppressor-like RCC1 family protein
VKRNRLRLGCVLILVSAGAAGCSADGGEGELGTQTSNLCSSVSVVTDDADYSAVPGQTVLWTASAPCTGTAEYIFWFRNPSTGVWSITQDWSTSNTFSWNTTGLPTGSWDMQVWVRDVPGAHYQAYYGRPFQLTPTAACTSESSTATPNPVVKGNTVTITNTAETCPNPEFLVYHLPPGGTYQIDSGYSSANSTYLWDTTSAAPGTHYFQIRARAQGSTVAYQAYSTIAVNVTGAAPCTSTSVTFSPVAHAPVGTQVTLNATATGCASPTFQYWYQPPGGAWQILQSYTSSGTAVWNTTLAAAGGYNFQVWARESGATSQFDAYVGRPYTLDPATPTSSASIGGGYAHNCVLLASGKVGCWGYGTFGQVGNGATAEKNPAPVAVTGLTNAISLTSGYSHSCAVRLGGAVSCWGSNLHGQLGNGTNTDASTPVTVGGVSSATSVAAGNAHTCVALVDGTVRCWGYNSQGQLGTGAPADSYVPVTVPGLSNVASVAGGYYHSCALLRDGTVRCWGLGTAGQLGNGGTSSPTPVPVTGLTNVVSIVANGADTCAVKSDGTIWCWGANTPYGSLGNGTTDPALVPVKVVGITNAKSVALGGYHSCATLTNGSVTCWGYNFYGQLGNETNTDSLVPVLVSGISTATSVGAATYTSCATLADGTSSCWGYGILGSLGDSQVFNSNIPVAVTPVP